MGPERELRARRLGADGGVRGADVTRAEIVGSGMIRAYGHDHSYFVGDNVQLAPNRAEVGARGPRLGRCTKRPPPHHPNQYSRDEHERVRDRHARALSSRRQQSLLEREQRLMHGPLGGVGGVGGIDGSGGAVANDGGSRRSRRSSESHLSSIIDRMTPSTVMPREGASVADCLGWGS